VLFKPSHGLRILKGDSGPQSGFSPKAAYIFRKQLEEADAIVINRIDELEPAAVNELSALVNQAFDGTPVLPLSAKTGQGFEALTQLLEQQGGFGRKILDIDYDVYAEGEAELGWLNSTARVSAEKPFAVDALLLAVVTQLREALAPLGEVAHMKAIGLSDVSFGVANLVSNHTAPELSLASKGSAKVLDLIVNIRAAVDPAVIETEVRRVVPSACATFGATATVHTMQCFRPGRPQPTHRYATAR
jgi:hypothetical protein